MMVVDCGREVLPKTNGIIVQGIERKPGGHGRGGVGPGVYPVGDQGGFAETGRGDDQRQGVSGDGPVLGLQVGTRDGLRPRPR